MDLRPIGVFDSGLGGLTCVKKLMDVMPEEDIIYLGDTGRVPYGGRSRETIRKYARQDIAFLRRFDIKAVVAACGTVSTNGLEEISGDYDIPVWGVAAAAAQAAAAATRNGKIGLIGTRASIRSRVYDDMLRAARDGLEIVKRACPLFVPLVEDGRGCDDPVMRLVAEEYLGDMRASGVDTLILGCTHYPIIRDVIAEVMGEGVTLIDPGAETALRLREELSGSGLGREGGRGTCRYFVTDSTEDFGEAASIFMGADVVGRVERVSLDDLS